MPETDFLFVRIRVTILLRRFDDRICLVRHLKDGRRYWLLPGGGQNPFEALEDTANRELMEELKLKVGSFRFLALRESMSPGEGRHIQFPIFEGIDPDFSTMEVGEDSRVEGIDFFNAEELAKLPVFPQMGNDLEKLIRGETVEPFKTLDWLP